VRAPRSDAIVIGSPGFNGSLDFFGRHVGFGGLAGEVGEFGVGGETQADDLQYGEPGVEELAGQREVARSWALSGKTRANSAVRNMMTESTKISEAL